jgi:hypothetical protein
MHIGVGSIFIEPYVVRTGFPDFARLRTEGRQDTGPVVESVRGGADPVLTGVESMNAIHAAIVRNSLAGDAERQTGAVSDYGNTFDSNPVLIEDAAGECAFAVHAELGEKIGVLRDEDRRALPVRAALAVGSGKIAFARGDQEIVAVGNAEEYELSGAGGVQLYLLEVDIVGPGDGNQADYGAGERVAGGEFLDGSLDDSGMGGRCEE